MKVAEAARNEQWYFTQSRLAAVRVGDVKFQLLGQPGGWFGPTVQLGWPLLYNLRLDPFERMGISPGESMMAMENYYGQEFWRKSPLS
jgi:arylsulfatase